MNNNNYIIGVDIGGTTYSSTCFDINGNVSTNFSRWYMFKQWIKGTLRGFTKLKIDGFSDHSIEAYYNFCRKEWLK